MVAAEESKLKSVLGLIAGDGLLPSVVARVARADGQRVHAVGFHGITDPSLETAVDHLAWLHLGEFQALIESLASGQVSEVVLAGKVSKQHLYGDVARLRPDARALDVIARSKDRRDDSLLDAIADALGDEGIALRSQLDFCAGLVAPPGVLGATEPTEAQWRDIRFGFPVARAMGGLDIGQTVVVEAGAVLAVEAIEGTDEAIRRGGGLGSGLASAVKVAKPQQDPRFDLPTVGPATVRAMCDSGVRVLAFEAHCTIILDRELLLRIADAHGVAVVAVARPD